jgi:hypothetical protein
MTNITHLIIGKDENIGPKTKTGCGKYLCDCKIGVTFQFRKSVNCPECLKKIKSIETMRGDKSCMK